MAAARGAIALVHGALFLDERVTAVALARLGLVLVGVALDTGSLDQWRIAAKAAGSLDA